jgi:hypothetical protein
VASFKLLTERLCNGCISSGTPTSEVLPDLKEFPEPPLDLTSDSVPVEDPTKSKLCYF